MTSHDFVVAVVGMTIGVGIVAAFIMWSKPSCRDGYVPITGNGWVCVPGYKPEGAY